MNFVIGKYSEPKRRELLSAKFNINSSEELIRKYFHELMYPYLKDEMIDKKLRDL